MTRSSPLPWRTFRDLPRAFGEISMRGRLRSEPSDFDVEEIARFAPDGQGEHVMLKVRKTGANTEWVARALASHAEVPSSAVGYAGLKDRNAVTTQWFTVHLGHRSEPDWGLMNVPGIEILFVGRHGRKLRRGALGGNRFRIRVRELTGETDRFTARLEQVRARGAPNYFGPQRFGHDDGNLHAAGALFGGGSLRGGRHQRGLRLSAVRSQLFNEVLALRVERGDWDRPLPGDRMQLSGSRSHFLVKMPDDELLSRTRAFDLDPTGPLWGAGAILSEGDPAAMERGVAARFPQWVEGLATTGLRHERRALRARVSDLVARREGEDLVLTFALPAGSYATTVLRELMDWSEPGLEAPITAADRRLDCGS